MPGHGGICVARHIFQACPVWIYTQSNIDHTSILYESRHIIYIKTPIGFGCVHHHLGLDLLTVLYLIPCPWF
jgi:hypothetical protein